MKSIETNSQGLAGTGKGMVDPYGLSVRGFSL
jgi:hypothetical protein